MHLVRGRPRPRSRRGGVGVGYGGAYPGKKVSESVRKCPKFSYSVPLFAIVCHFPVLELGLDAVAGAGAVAFFGINDFSGLERVSDEGSRL